MKKILLSIVLGAVLSVSAQTDNTQLTPEQTRAVAVKLMAFYRQYENGAPESVKRAKFNEYVDEVNPALSGEERERAYAIVNAYIMADMGQGVEITIPDEDKEQLEEMSREAEAKKKTGEEAAIQKVTELKQMSYDEYRDYVTQNGEVYIEENEIRKAYNAMHRDDPQHQVALEVEEQGKPVTVDNPVQAIDIVKHPDKHTFTEFKAAMKFLKPDITDEEINKMWEHKNK